MMKPEYSGTTRTMTWLLMPWLLISPSHQQLRDWQFKMGPCLLRGRTSRTCIISVPTIEEVSHYNDVPMSAMAFQITSFPNFCTVIYSGLDHRKHQSTAPLAFVRGFTGDRWIPRTKGQAYGKGFHLMTSSCNIELITVDGQSFRIQIYFDVRIYKFSPTRIKIVLKTIACYSSLFLGKTTSDWVWLRYNTVWSVFHHTPNSSTIRDSNVCLRLPPSCHVNCWIFL